MPLLRLPPVGLYTDPSPYGEVPAGALSTASDVSIRRKGIVQQRPGFAPVSPHPTPAAGYNQAFRLIPFGSDVLVICNDEGTANEKGYWLSSGTEVFGGPVASTVLSAEYGRAFWAKAREALYIGGDTFTYKLTSNTDVQGDAAGLPRAHSIRASLTVLAGTMLATNSEVAYRVIWRRKDANGNVLRSSPSPRCVVRNASGATVYDVDVYVTIPVEIVAGDTAEVYRSNAIAFASGSPDDELGLVKEYTIVAGDKTANVFSFTDTRPDNTRGAIYYAAPSREGIQNSNERPPLAKDLAFFADSMFYAGGAGFEQMSVELLDVAGVGDADGFGYRTTTSDDITTGVANITLASIVGVTVGMAVSEGTAQPDAGNANLAANTIITGMPGGNVITVSPVPTGTPGAGRTVRIHDVLKVLTSADASPAVFYASDGWSAAYTGLSGRSFPVTSAFADERLDIRDTSIALAHAIDSWLDASNYAHVPNVIRTSSDDAETAQGNMLWRARWPGTAHRFAITSTHGTAFSFRHQGTVTGSNNPMSSADEGQNILWWSKFNQPEAVPPLNFAPVGAENDPILRVVPLADAMYVFKLSGEVYRVTGAGADAGFRLDLVSTSCRLLSWNCLDVLGDQIVVWSAEGLGFFTERGVVRIDEPIRNILEPFTRYYSPNESTAPSGGPTSGAIPIVFANERVGEIVVGIPNTTSIGEVCSVMYVFNVNTSAWVMWEKAFRTMAVKASGALLFSDGADAASTFTIYEERIASLPGSVILPGAVQSEYYDEEIASVTVSSVSPNDSTLITIAGGSGWTPIAGDALVQSGEVFLVVKVTSATVFYVDRAGITTGGGRTARVGINGIIRFTHTALGSPAMLARWGNRTDEFLSHFGIARVLLGVASNWQEVEETQTLANTFHETAAPRPVRSMIPRSAALATSIAPSISIRQAVSRWLYAGLTLEVAPVGVKATRDMQLTSATTGAATVVG